MSQTHNCSGEKKNPNRLNQLSCLLMLAGEGRGKEEGEKNLKGGNKLKPDTNRCNSNKVDRTEATSTRWASQAFPGSDYACHMKDANANICSLVHANTSG